jgi:diaminohydroxyphosphoribosylaminopyrimidine deaminase/5-amino-6-(5-phosphoribosylamino)uracil reductase
MDNHPLDETDAMRRAIDLAWRGWGRVHPNPLVGAVVLRDGAQVGEGYHAEFGGPHAEAVALEEAGAAAQGSTLVVTLEPCTHQGKQPPCVDLIRRHGVRRVVTALRDPNPEAGGGLEQLRASGLEIATDVLSDPAARENAIFLHQFFNATRPYVALKLATTVDARIADRQGRSRWISGEEARTYVHWLRAGFDAIGIGGHTARVDDASLTVRGPVEPRQPPLRVVFDPDADLPETLQLVRTAREIPTLVVAGPQATALRVSGLERAGVTVERAGSLTEAVALLRKRGVLSLLVEGGGRLAAALLGEDLVDRFYWVQSPLWLGEAGVPAFSGVLGRGVAEAVRWRVIERRALGEDTLLVMDRR